ncbi:MAG TPA: VUT family protein [Gammaproteobacteria bacterium]|nr:VUT family protein [Gammaproteobacteria bacterium]
MIVVILSCDALAFKTVNLFGHPLAASGLIFPLSFILISILAEVYGYAKSGRIIVTQLLCSFIFIGIVNVLVLLNHASTIDSSYYLIYHSFWRVILGTLAGTPLAYFFTTMVLSRIKVTFANPFIFRFLVSNIVGKFLLVSITYPINFYHLHSVGFIISLILNTWLFKSCIAIIFAPIVLVLSAWVKRIEKLDTFDYGVSYNPANIFEEKQSGENLYHAK